MTKLPEFLLDSYPTKNGHVTVVRDDIVPGGTKQRVLEQWIAEMGPGEYVYASPAEGYAQIALALTCAALGSGYRANVFVARRKEMHLRTQLARKAGAIITEIENVPAFNVLTARARAYAAPSLIADRDMERKLLPFGLDAPRFKELLVSIIKGGVDYKPKEVWSVVGSGTLIRCLQEVWPKASFNAVQVGHKADIGKAERYIAPEKFSQRAKFMPPYPSCDSYDAKAWQFVYEHAADGALVWNVAADREEESSVIKPISQKKLNAALRDMGTKFLRSDLRDDWSADNPTRNYCYVIAEVVYWYLAPNGSTVWELKLPGELAPHRFVKDPNGNILDMAAEQFDFALPYSQAREKFFMQTGGTGPSKRAKILAEKLGLSLTEPGAAPRLTPSTTAPARKEHKIMATLTGNYKGHVLTGEPVPTEEGRAQFKIISWEKDGKPIGQKTAKGVVGSTFVTVSKAGHEIYVRMNRDFGYPESVDGRHLKFSDGAAEPKAEKAEKAEPKAAKTKSTTKTVSGKTDKVAKPEPKAEAQASTKSATRSKSKAAPAPAADADADETTETLDF